MLWDNADNTIIGEKPARRDSSLRTVKEAHISDILSALRKLDSENKLPCVAVTGKDLRLLPRSHPEEINTISLADRVNCMEAKITQLQKSLEIAVNNSAELRDIVFSANLSATSTAATSNDSSANQNTQSDPSSSQVIGRSNESASVSEPTPAAEQSHGNNSDGTDRSLMPPPRDNPPAGHRKKKKKKAVKNSIPRSINNDNNSLQNNPSLALLHPDLRTSLASLASQVSRADTVDSQFTLPSDQQRKRQRAEKRRRTGICGTAGNFRSFGVGSEPSRDIFIGYVSKDTEIDDIKSFVTAQGHGIRGLSRVSHPDARCQSFKLTVAKSDLKPLLNKDIWPNGICVKKFSCPQSRVSNPPQQ